MSTLTLRYDFTSSDGMEIRSPSVPVTLAYTKKVDAELVLAAGTAYTLWDATDTAPLAPTTFTGLILLALDGDDIEIELTTQEGDANARQGSVTLKEGWPFLLGDDDGRYNYTVGAAGDAFAGTAGVIKLVRAKNTHATSDLTLRVIILS